MASWLARSIADSLRLDDDHLGQQDQYEDDGPRPDSDGDDRSEAAVPDRSPTSDRDGEGPKESSEEAHARGVKEDLEELKQSLTRQLWGVANLIAPLPSSSVSPLDAWDREGEEEDVVEEESGEENDDEELVVVGVKEEVLNFASNIAMHPETWLDFPLDPDEDLDDFEMSEAQQEHVLAIESFSPRLRALRIELCPCHMSESYFWKVYFVLLHSRLDKHDSEILSTPQVMEARALWMQELHKQTKMESDWLGRSIYHMKTYSDKLGEDFPSSPSYTHSGGLPFKSFDFETVKSSMSRYSDSERCLSLSSETQIVDTPNYQSCRT
ncbi:hypothetical protein MLD38_034850 [Melastoma candidum]|uniref:Uncharacterized protein n=1 Tax=Melastoma candidum TaxID=119954 RepID=A0ACB9MB92_9MYRT|nr:hypothetical protein MLD38_034850 [Melastoma candidum]